MTRKETKVINIGGRKIGGGNPVAIQSMTNTKTEDVESTVAQILALEKAGCEIIRCAVPNMEAAQALKEIKKHIHIPLVADIHFDYRLAIAAIENGADKIRINPGNIGSEDRVRAVVEKAKEYEALQSNVVTAAKRGYVDLIIEPADTRKYLVAAFEMLFTKRMDTPYKKHGTK